MTSIQSPQPPSTLIQRLPLVGPIYKDAMTYRRLKAGVANLSRNSISVEHEGLPVPPIKLRDMVRKGGILVEDFLLEGAQVFDALVEIEQAHGVVIDGATRVYEFGVGCGRVARHFLTKRPCLFAGSDVDEELIGWCKEKLGPARTAPAGPDFFVNAFLPPIAKPDESFDFIYAISVVTHMTPEHQRAWMRELHRLLAPKGHLVLSILEKTPTEAPRGVLARERVDMEFTRGWLGKGAAPPHYYNTYNTVDHISGLLSEELRLVDHWPNAIRNTQSLLLFQKD
jgi:SAM-dependent methyltransferase